MTHALVKAHEAHLRAGGLSERTINDRSELLDRLESELPHGLNASTTDELAQWLGRPEWSQWTLCTYYGHIIGYYRWASSGSHPYLDYDPSAELRRPTAPKRVPNPVTDAELDEALTLSAFDPRWQLAISLAAFAGLRAREISQQAREDVTVDNIRVLGKGNKLDLVPTHPKVWEMVRSLPSGPLLRSRTGRSFGGGNLSVMARHHFDRIGMPDVHLHRFRHWFATSLLRAGVDIRVVQELMRHESLATTAGYLQVTDPQRRAGIQSLVSYDAGRRTPVRVSPPRPTDAQQNAA